MRLNYREVSPDALKAMLGLEAVANRGLDDQRLLDLVKVRASQINGCASAWRFTRLRPASTARPTSGWT